MTPPRRLSLLLVAAALLASGCSGRREDPILRLSAEEALAAGKELMEAEKYAAARPYLTHAFEVEPNSPVGREGLLLVADSHYLEGGSDNYIKAEAKYRDFQNRFPTSERSPYVQLQIANALFERMERPDRDQTATEQALEAYEELLRLYPASEYAEEARARIREVKANLAEHEFLVGRFYYRFGLPRAAIERFEYLLEEYPDYPERDKVIYHLGLAHQRADQTEEAHQAFERLRREYPDSRFVAELPPSEEAAGEASEERSQ